MAADTQVAGAVPPLRSHASAARAACLSRGLCRTIVVELNRQENLEAPPGFEPGMEVLQTGYLTRNA